MFVRAVGRGLYTTMSCCLVDSRLGLGCMVPTGIGSCALRASVGAVSAGVSSEQVSVSEFVRREAVRVSLSRVRMRRTHRVSGLDGAAASVDALELRANSRLTGRRDRGALDSVGSETACCPSARVCAELALRWIASRRGDCILDLSFRPHDSIGIASRQAFG